MSDVWIDHSSPGPRVPAVTQHGQGISPTKVLRDLEPNQSFIVDNKRSRDGVVSAAHRMDIKIRSRKEPDGTYRIWRE